MNTTTTTPSLIEIHSMGKAIEIEYQWLFPERTGQPLIIFCMKGWDQFPCGATGRHKCVKNSVAGA